MRKVPGKLTRFNLKGAEMKRREEIQGKDKNNYLFFVCSFLLIFSLR